MPEAEPKMPEPSDGAVEGNQLPAKDESILPEDRHLDVL